MAKATVRSTKTGRCMFCGANGPLEGEHVFPAWLRTQLKVTGHRKHRLMLGQHLTVVRHWQKPMATARVWAVCHTCNHGWMKDLEDAVLPTLSVLARLGTTIVPAGSQQLLALWAMKTSAVAQELNPNNLKPIGVGTCPYLRLARKPPDGATAWLLPSQEPDMDAFCWIAIFGVGPNEVGYTAQVLVGRVRLAVIGPVGRQELPIQPSGILGVAAIPIWPMGPGLLAHP